MSVVEPRFVSAASVIPYRIKLVDPRNLELTGLGPWPKKWRFYHDGFTMYDEVVNLARRLFPYQNIGPLDTVLEVPPGSLLEHYRGYRPQPSTSILLLMAERELQDEIQRRGGLESSLMDPSEENLAMLESFHSLTPEEFLAWCCEETVDGYRLHPHRIWGDQAWMVKIPDDSVNESFVSNIMAQAESIAPGKLQLVQNWSFRGFVCAHYRGARVELTQDGLASPPSKVFALSAPMELSYHMTSFMKEASKMFDRVSPFDMGSILDVDVLKECETEPDVVVTVTEKPVCRVAPNNSHRLVQSVATVRCRMRARRKRQVPFPWLYAPEDRYVSTPVLSFAEFAEFLEGEEIDQALQAYKDETGDRSLSAMKNKMQKQKPIVLNGGIRWIDMADHLLKETNGGRDEKFAAYCSLWKGLRETTETEGGENLLVV